MILYNSLTVVGVCLSCSLHLTPSQICRGRDNYTDCFGSDCIMHVVPKEAVRVLTENVPICGSEQK